MQAEAGTHSSEAGRQRRQAAQRQVCAVQAGSGRRQWRCVKGRRTVPGRHTVIRGSRNQAEV